MTEKRDRRGTFWDWPTGWMIAGVLLAFVSLSNGAGGGLLIGLIVGAVGVVAFVIRRGSFTPREP